MPDQTAPDTHSQAKVIDGAKKARFGRCARICDGSGENDRRTRFDRTKELDLDTRNAGRGCDMVDRRCNVENAASTSLSCEVMTHASAHFQITTTKTIPIALDP